MNRRGFFGWLAAAVAGLFGVRPAKATASYRDYSIPFEQLDIYLASTTCLLFPEGKTVLQFNERFIFNRAVKFDLPLPPARPGYRRVNVSVKSEDDVFSGKTTVYRSVNDERIADI